MRLGQVRPLTKQFLPQRSRSIFLFVNPATLQLGNQEIDDIFVSLRHHRISQIESIQVGLFHPLFELISDLFWGSEDDRAPSTKPDKLSNLADLPPAVRIA